LKKTLRERKIEFRRGTSGVGNQLRQPFMRKLMPNEYKKYPKVKHVTFTALISALSELETDLIEALCKLLTPYR